MKQMFRHKRHGGDTAAGELNFDSVTAPTSDDASKEAQAALHEAKKRRMRKALAQSEALAASVLDFCSC